MLSDSGCALVISGRASCDDDRGAEMRAWFAQSCDVCYVIVFESEEEPRERTRPRETCGPTRRERHGVWLSVGSACVIVA